MGRHLSASKKKNYCSTNKSLLEKKLDQNDLYVMRITVFSSENSHNNLIQGRILLISNFK